MTGTKLCFHDPAEPSWMSDSICITYQIFGPENSSIICSARKREGVCKTCTYDKNVACLNDKRLGFVLDCSNVSVGYDRVTACESQKDATVKGYLPASSSSGIRSHSHSSSHWDTQPPFSSSSSSHYSNQPHYRNSSSNNYTDDDISGHIFFLIILFVFCTIRITSQRAIREMEPNNNHNAGRRQHRRRYNPRTGQVEIIDFSAVPQQEVQLRPMANRETIPDAHNPCFSFFQATEKDPETAANVRMQVINDDWQPLRDFFASLRRGNNSNQRYFWMSVVEREIAKGWSTTEPVNDNARMSTMLDDWLEQEPDSIDCRLLRLNTHTAWAWNARTAALARSVSAQRAAVFQKRLLEAAEEFVAAKKYCSNDPLLYAFGMTIALGLGGSARNQGVSMEECQQQLKNATDDPLCYTAHTRALQYNCRKWYGTHQRMFQYVYEITNGLPDRHPLWVLIPMAHYERVLIERSPGYWRRDNVGRDIMGAYRKAFPDNLSETTVQATTAHDWNMEWASRNYFLYCLSLMGRSGAARNQIRVIGRRPSERPWHSLIAYKNVLRELGFDTTEASPLGRPGPDGVPMARIVIHRVVPAATIVTPTSIPVVSAELDDGEEDTDDLPVVTATVV